jgi:hypothetical protein
MAAHKLINNFTGGELSPQLDARVDLQKYDTACRTMENYRPLPWGGALFRSGTLFIAETKDSSKASRLIPFNFSTTTTYALEFGHLYIRFYTAGAQVTSAGSPYEIVSPYTETQLFQIQFKEINDVVYLVHPELAPRKLSRLAATNWTLTEVEWVYPPLLDENDTTTTLQIPAVGSGSLVTGRTYKIVSVGTSNFVAVGAASNTVGVVFTATGTTAGTGTALQTTGAGASIVSSSSLFVAGHVGAYFELKHLREAAKVEIDISGSAGTTTSDVIRVKGEWALVTSERWYGELKVQRSLDNGTTWETFRTFTARSDRNVNVSGNQETAAQFRLVFTAAGDPYGASAWTGTAPTNYVKARAALEVADAYIAGLVKITAVGSGTSATCTILAEVEASTTTKIWSEGAWSTVRGYPRSVALYEQRMIYGGTATKPTTIWGSVTADFDNFAYSEFDDAAFAYHIAATEQNPVQWIATLDYINVGTSGGEFSARSGNGEEPLTPSNMAVRGGTNYGSEFQRALKVDDAMIFLQRQGSRIRELFEQSPYVNTNDRRSSDLTLLAEHMTETGVVQMDFARLPDGQLYVIRGDGRMAVCTYNREQNITAWARYITPGSFQSVACVYGTPADTVYVIVRRIINNSIKRYVEVFTANLADKTQGVFMDSAKTYSFGSPSTSCTGLDHLEGERVSVVADGAVVSNAFSGEGAVLTVSGGQITLPTAATTVRVGAAYGGKLKPMKLDLLMANGTSQGRKRRISEVVVRFKDTLGGKVGTASNQVLTDPQFSETIPFRTTSTPMDQSPPLFTGDVPVTWQGNADFSGDIQVTQNDPLPMTVLGIFAKFEVFGE